MSYEWSAQASVIFSLLNKSAIYMKQKTTRPLHTAQRWFFLNSSNISRVNFYARAQK